MNLAVVENHIEPGEHVKRAIASEIDHADELPCYPGNKLSPARVELESAIRTADSIPDNLSILLTHGSDSALRAILASFADDENPPCIMHPYPTYPHFLTFLGQLKGTAASWPVKVGQEDDPIDCIKDALRDTLYVQLVYIVSPSLPFGHVIDLGKLKDMAEMYHQTLFVIDEAYVDYQSPRQTAIGICPNVLVTRTFSKSYALASVRLGWMVGDKNLLGVIEASLNQKDVTDYSCRLGKAALDDNAYYTACAKSVMGESRAELASIPGVRFGAGGNFGLLTMQEDGDPPVQKFVDILRTLGFLTRNKSAEIPATIRFTIPPVDVARKLASAIQTVRSTWRSML